MKLCRIAAVGLALSTACAGTRSAVPRADSDRSWARETLAALTLEEKVGQLIYPRTNGLFVSEADPDFRALLSAAREGRIGGLVFFKGDPFETAAIANRLQAESRLPLLVASDCEWGAAMRVEGASRFPRAMVLGASGSKDDVEFSAEVTAREARALGVHLLLNPVLDLNTNPENPVIDTRSFGESPETVAELGAAYIRRAQDLGVLATAKHFPGHGGTAVDSHLSLPVIRDDRERLSGESLVPFRAAIEAGVAAVMTAHVAVPALDGQERRPATLSPEILEDLLRRELGFRGLVVSDALDMGGAREGAWDGEVAVAALGAGVDMLLVPPDPLVAHRAVIRAVRRGDLSEARLDQSVLRVLEAKEALDLHRRRSVDPAELPQRLARPSVSARIEEMAGRGVTVIANRGGVLPFRSEAPPGILLVTFGEDLDPDVQPEILAEELGLRTRIREVRATARDDARVAEEIASDGADVLLMASYLRSRSFLGRAELPALAIDAARNRAASGKVVVFAALGSPYLLTALPEASALVAAYDFAPASQRALARGLFGEIDLGAKLPVTLSPEYPLGRGTSIPERRMKLEMAKRPEDVGFSEDGLGEAVRVLKAGIEGGTAPGAVALVARRGKIVLERAVGRLSYDEDAAPVTRETLYDLASLTKVVVTTTLAMMLYERGRLDLDAPVTSYVPEFKGGEKDRVTVRDLLAHSGGLLWWTDLYKRFEGKPPAESRDGYLRTIYSMPLDYSPRAKMVYSDLGILLLGEILERVTGKDLKSMAREEIFEPLDMDDTMFQPDASVLSRIAPTELDPWRGRVVRGEVHDENAFGLGGVAPHAGLFSTARSLAQFAQMMINGGAGNGRRLLNPETIALFTTRANLVPGSSRALGWDTPSESSSAGRFFSVSSYGHTGFTGTSLWIDPERELFVILLTNRVHPTRENPKITDLRPAFHDAVARAIVDVEIQPRPAALH
jgi:beta-glucosidase-like glycosyl hydrolase/CubicO group peptidase (beta-lactamase class C family)